MRISGKQFRIIFLIISILTASSFLPYPTQLIRTLASPTDKPTLQILMIGNSFTFGQNMPSILEQILIQSNHPSQVEMVAPPGQYLDWHATNPATLTALQSKHWNVVILQDCSTCPLEFRDYFESGVKKMVQAVRSAGATPLLFETWSDKGLVQDQQIITAEYRRLGIELDLPVVPVGQVWAQAQALRPSLNLYANDNHHAGAEGALLTAYTFAAFLYPGKVHLLAGLRREPRYFYEIFLPADKPLAAASETNSFLLRTANAKKFH